LAKKGMRFDVRAIAIGAVFDQAAAKLAESGIRSAMISSPRVCRTMGDPPAPRGFEMTVGDPYDPAKAWATVRVPVGGIAYACAGVNRFSENGSWYHSLLDPRTGRPATRCAGAIVQAPTATTAQALAYGLFVFGTLDSLQKDGRTAVGGSVVIDNKNGTLTAAAAGSLAEKFERVP
ncbi:MAG: FAD:protein FMN transferase, partial [bacterium]|nr:FAD:protein FMN transferase [bacterium]